MNEYIEREAAIEYLTLNMGWNDEDGYPVDDWDERKANIADLINGIPAADVRPVVRCRDCMYAPSGTGDGEDQGFSLEWPYDEWPEDNPCPCKCEDGWYSHKPKPDFFCANGKRKES